VYVVPDGSAPEETSSDNIFNVLLLISSCKYKSCNPMMSLDFGTTAISMIDCPWTFFNVEMKFTELSKISPF